MELSLLGLLEKTKTQTKTELSYGVDLRAEAGSSTSGVCASRSRGPCCENVRRARKSKGADNERRRELVG